jgi:hypothetical protein
MSLGVGGVDVLLYGEEIEAGQPWISEAGNLCVSVWISDQCDIQGTPQDMDRLAEAARTAAAQAHTAEPELPAAPEQDGGR